MPSRTVLPDIGPLADERGVPRQTRRHFFVLALGVALPILPSRAAAASVELEGLFRLYVNLGIGPKDRPIVESVSVWRPGTKEPEDLPPDAWTVISWKWGQRLHLRYRGSARSEVKPFELRVEVGSVEFRSEGRVIKNNNFDWICT